MQSQIKSKLKKVIKLEMQRLLQLYAIEPLDSREIERSIRIIKAAVDTLLKLESKENAKSESMNIKIILDE